jgi:signal transduction histidine kinase
MRTTLTTYSPVSNPDILSLIEAQFYRDEFLALASHELKTPLTALKLQTQVFKRFAKKSTQDFYQKDKVDELIDKIDIQSTKLVKLINSMLDISRVRSGRLVIVKEFFNLSEVFEEALGHYGLIAQRKKEIFIWADRERILQVFDILLSNAFKYGNSRPIEVKLTKKKDWVEFSVKDQGIGLSQEDQKRIFHQFQRGVPASQVSGLGLGLFIARQIMIAHGGDISVQSKLHQGSKFKVKLRIQETL